MKKEQKEYIEKNIDLIEAGDWDIFFQDPADGVGYILYESGIPFIEALGSIPNKCFAMCKELKTFNIPEFVTSIDSNAFYGCSNLRSIGIPASVKRIGMYAFAYCDNMKNFVIPDTVTDTDGHTFVYSKFKTISFGRGIKEITESMCDSCSNLASINIPDNITTIGRNAFRDCKNLSNVIIGDGVTDIMKGAFMWCPSLTDVVVGNSVTYIHDYAFYRSPVRKLTLPNTLEGMGLSVFGDTPDFEITYNGTKKEWSQIHKTYSFKNVRYTCACTDGIVTGYR